MYEIFFRLFPIFLVNLTPSSWATHVAWTLHRFFRKLRPIDNMYCSAVLFTSSGCKVRKNAPYVPKCDVGWCLFFQLQNGDKTLVKSQIYCIQLNLYQRELLFQYVFHDLTWNCFLTFEDLPGFTMICRKMLTKLFWHFLCRTILRATICKNW